MVNKKGYLRIIEAIIAVLIVIGAILIAINKNSSSQSEDFCQNVQSYIEEIGKNNELRNAVLTNNTGQIEVFLSERINNPLIDYQVKICEPNEFCTLDKAGLDNIEVCAGERLISTTQNSDSFEPKKLKVFLFKR